MSILVPNLKPTLELDYRLAVIGESPGPDDASVGQPFVGTSGRLLTSVLQRAGVTRSACFIGNICQVVKRSDDIKGLDLDDPDVQLGLNTLKHELEEFNPHCVFLLGKSPLRSAGIMHGVNDFRGSLFTCMDTSSPFFRRKCISSFNPAAVTRNFEWMPLLQFDAIRAKSESHSPDLRLPKRTFEVELTCEQIIQKLDAIQPGTLTSVDIEGGIPPKWPGVTCVGISTDPSHGFIVNLQDFGSTEQVQLLYALSRVLCNPSIPKVLQNSLYDNFVLSWLFKLPIRNVVWDTMLSGWEIYPELPKGLGAQASIWTRQPYYKFERKIDDKLTHYRYCCMDAAVTLEIAKAHQSAMSSKPEAQRHFNFNMSLLPVFHYMELKGFRYNHDLAKTKHSELTSGMLRLQTLINKHAGVEVNPNSPKQMTDLLYRRMGYEPQYAKERGRKTDRLTADVEALLVLLKKHDSELVATILKWRSLEGQRKQLEIPTDADGRMRCSYNVVGTETGRLTCSESPTGTGTNLTTITKKLRCLYQADPGKLMFQCDLSGADGWTVAARCQALGDDTMFKDYQFGLKPARIIAAMRETLAQKTNMSLMSRDEIKSFIKSISIPEWLYFSCKRVQHGSNYRLGPITMASVILKDSWKVDGNPVYVSTKDCKDLQSLYLQGRYIGVPRWHEWAERELLDSGKLGCASGHIRTFFGRRKDHTTLNEFLAHEPQANTTYVTNLALYNLWNDPENRDSRDAPIIEPLHQVHDALIGQFPEDRLEWALAKIRSYFNNFINIAGVDLVIPFEGNYGLNWGELEHAI